MKIILTLLALLSNSAFANEVTIVEANAVKTANNTYSFSVTLKHEDSGWNHYADQWQVFTPGNKLLGTRTLYHPHVKEQPFTRSLNDIKVPNSIANVIIKARDTEHGISSQTYKLKLE